jgi:hypothetical protein
LKLISLCQGAEIGNILLSCQYIRSLFANAKHS